MSKQVKYNKGELYEVVFKDHATGNDCPIVCSAVGYVIADNVDYIRLSHWIVHTDCADTYNLNLEKTVILKCCIIERKRLCKIKMK